MSERLDADMEAALLKSAWIVIYCVMDLKDGDPVYNYGRRLGFEIAGDKKDAEARARELSAAGYVVRIDPPDKTHVGRTIPRNAYAITESGNYKKTRR